MRFLRFIDWRRQYLAAVLHVAALMALAIPALWPR